jgi:formylmethanofuran dehydrogenase subunit E
LFFNELLTHHTRGNKTAMETSEANPRLKEMLGHSAAQHRHLCPRQVLGVRIGLYAADIFSIATPQKDKRLLAFVETDGCFADGVSAATGCSMGHRTMRLVDYGKVAVTFVDTHDGRAIRLSPLPNVRLRAAAAAPVAATRWQAQLQAYQVLQNIELFQLQAVRLNLDLEAITGKPGVRVTCSECGEEILNQRETVKDGQKICRSCAGESYWRLMEDSRDFAVASAQTTCG